MERVVLVAELNFVSVLFRPNVWAFSMKEGREVT